MKVVFDELVLYHVLVFFSLIYPLFFLFSSCSFSLNAMGASEVTKETRAGGVLAETGHKLAFIMWPVRGANTHGERLLAPKQFQIPCI